MADERFGFQINLPDDILKSVGHAIHNDVERQINRAFDNLMFRLAVLGGEAEVFFGLWINSKEIHGQTVLKGIEKIPSIYLEKARKEVDTLLLPHQ